MKIYSDNEYIKLDNYFYKKIIHYLIKKYGRVNGNYFINESCDVQNSKIKRFKNEGLYIHHIMEDKFHYLSDKDYAILSPFYCQKSENLVYCNLIEHYILHIKIFLKTKRKFGGYGFKMIDKELFNFFNYGEISKEFKDGFEIISNYECKTAFNHYHNKYAHLLYSN